MTTKLSSSEGLDLLTKESIENLRAAASIERFRKHPSKQVTYVLDTNPNYTNICSFQCSFCAFKKNASHPESYHKSIDEVLEDIKAAHDCGLTTVLLQGGIHEGVTVDYLRTLVEKTRTYFPSIDPHFFSAPEILAAARNSKLPLKEALQMLWDAGQRTIPGGGAEILSSKVHKRISPQKTTPQEWLDVHKTAHEIGFKTTATMMFGHVETPEDIIEHLVAIRDLQDLYGGFLSFIPWSYKRANNPLGNVVLHNATPTTYLKILAVSRVFLHNFDHITGSWFGEGKAAGVESLHFGADDFGGTICQEAVHKAAGHVNTITEQEIRSLIQSAGYEPVRRDALYTHLN